MNMPNPDLKADRIRKIAAVIVILCLVSSGWWSQFEWNVIAVKYTTDQHKLARIALETELEGVRHDAMAKLTDQALLGKIAMGSADSWARLDAVSKLTDQVLLGEVAMESAYDWTRHEAARKLGDSTVLVKIAFEARDKEVRNIAYDKVNPANAELTALSTSAQDPTTHLYASVILRIQNAIQSIPKEHRERLSKTIMQIASVLVHPRVIAELGDIEDIRMAWTPRSAQYSLCTVYGENVTLSVKLSKQEQTITYARETFFPGEIRIRFKYGEPEWISAPINAGSFFEDISGFLSEPTRAWFAMMSEDPDVRYTAVKLIADQAVLAKVAAEDKVESIRHAAVAKLTDQATLAKVALEDEDWGIRYAAVKKLTDQALLAKIAAGDKYLAVREAALAKLADPAVRARIAGKIREGAIPSGVSQAPSEEASIPKEITDPSHLLRPAGTTEKPTTGMPEYLPRKEKEQSR